jgi:hypothetical protein
MKFNELIQSLLAVAAVRMSGVWNVILEITQCPPLIEGNILLPAGPVYVYVQ